MPSGQPAQPAQPAETAEVLARFSDPALAKQLLDVIYRLAPAAGSDPVTFMEVCGTHTVSIARAGIRSLMPDTVRLASGPGCPVCVTDNRDIDTIIALSRIPEVTMTTFGDMMRVPGSTSSLQAEKAAGRSVEVVYSPLDALALAQANPDRQIVFAGVGFETTAPLTAMAIKRAAALGLDNFSVFCAHKNMPGALEVLVADPKLQIDGFILPGHVSVITGSAPYMFLAQRYGMPGVITGFEPVDILQGIAMLLRQRAEGRADIEIAYARAVAQEGNPVALAAIDEVFDTCAPYWRGLGVIEGSGYELREEFARFDARKRFDPDVEPTRHPNGCRCGDVLRSAITPHGCPLYKKACTPENPLGPCMVSSEGTCAAYYRFDLE